MSSLTLSNAPGLPGGKQPALARVSAPGDARIRNGPILREGEISRLGAPVAT